MCPDLIFLVQACARFCHKANQLYEEAIKCISYYLLKMKDQGLVLWLKKGHGLECYVDADWVGSWQNRPSNDPLSPHLRIVFVIMYAGCPILWGSKHQILIVLLTSEAEYIALCTALPEVISIMNLLNELKS